MELLEDLGQLLGRNSDAVVLDRELDRALVELRAERDAARLWA
jgi:hypothetical protein